MGVRTAGAHQNLTGPKRVLKGGAPAMNTTTSNPAPVPSVSERHYLFSPDYLAVLTKVDTGERDSLVEFRFTASSKPALAHTGERCRALIMPVRSAG
jgi:hypothetical protein